MSTALFNNFTATIAAAGTLSAAIDTEGWNVAGLIAKATTSTLIPGTLTAEVSNDGVTFVTVQAPTSGVLANVTLGHGTGNFGAVLDMIAPFRYVRFSNSVAQPNGMTLLLSVKQH